MNTRLLTHAEQDRSELADIKKRLAEYWEGLKSYHRDFKKKRTRADLEKKREKSGDNAEKFGDAIEGISKFMREQIKIALQDFSYSVQLAETNIGRPLTLTHEFVSASTALRIQEEIATQISNVEDFAKKIEDEEFIGPLRPEMKSLVDEFRAQKIGREQFVEEALSIRGIIFSDSGAHVALSESKMESLRDEFNFEKRDTAVFVFSRAAMHISFTPDRSHIHATRQQEMVPALAPAPRAY